MAKLSETLKHPSPSRWALLIAFSSSALFIFLLCFFFDPRWETNDDVGLSMVAHGYGIAAFGSPKLVFSNVVWGHIVRLIPAIHGLLGYSIATLSVLIIIGTTITYGLYRFGASHMACFCAVSLILLRPVLFPQFTINAGLLMVAAVVCWQLYVRQNDWRIVMMGCLLAFLSYLIRREESLLILLVALPLIPWQTLVKRRISQIAFLTLFSAIAISTIVDQQAYHDDNWKEFNELKTVIKPIVDFGAGTRLRQRPDILNRYDYSPNDINLIEDWFFVDQKITNPVALHKMLDELGPLHEQPYAMSQGWNGVKAIFHPSLLPVVITAILLAVIRPSWKLAICWICCFSAIFILGFLGRPGVLRVYVPLISLLIVAPFFTCGIPTWRTFAYTCVLLVATLLNAFQGFSDSRAFQSEGWQTRKELANLPNELLFNWGAAFPFETVYPVLGSSPSEMSHRLYSLGGLTYAPYTNSFSEQKLGHGMIDLLPQKSGILLVADEHSIRYLQIYCKEHLTGTLKELSSQSYGNIKLSRYRCEQSL